MMRLRTLWVPVGALACLLAGCGAEDEVGGTTGDSVEAVQGAASTARFDSGTISAASRCSTTSATARTGLDGSGRSYWLNSKDVAVLTCPMPSMLPGTPWDTAMLTRFSYSYTLTTSTSVLVCRIGALYNGVTQLMTPPMLSVPGATATTGDGWVKLNQPTLYTFKLFCYLPPGIKFYDYNYSYLDWI
jgi:hypothetical protein